MRQLSTSLKQEIVQLLSQGKSLREIAEKFNISKSAVGNVRKELLPNHKVEKKGRPSKLSKLEKRFCVKEATLNGLDTAVEINKELKNSLGTKVNDNTVRRALKNSGFKAIEKESKTFLSAKNIKSRLKFAKEHKN